MSNRNGNGLLTLALGAGGGVALWYVLGRPKTNAGSGQPAAAPQPTNTSTPAPRRAGTCTVRLDARGLTADGAPITIEGVVKRCQVAARADVTVGKDAPVSALVDLTAALARVGVPVAAIRNARRSTRTPRARAEVEPRAPAEVDLDHFARTVRDVAEKIEPDVGPSGLARGRFGSRKVFIAAILRGLVGTRYGELAPRAIDELFLRALRAGSLHLARADLVAAMDPDEVRASEIVDPHVGATFHFVISERGTDGATP